MATGSAQPLEFSRVIVESGNKKKITSTMDFIYGEYKAYDDFFKELSRITTSLMNTGEVVLNTGQKASMNDLGGMMSIQLYMETIESTKETMVGLSRLGVKAENKLWQLQN